MAVKGVVGQSVVTPPKNVLWNGKEKRSVVAQKKKCLTLAPLTTTAPAHTLASPLLWLGMRAGCWVSAMTPCRAPACLCRLHCQSWPPSQTLCVTGRRHLCATAPSGPSFSTCLPPSSCLGTPLGVAWACKEEKCLGEVKQTP